MRLFYSFFLFSILFFLQTVFATAYSPATSVSVPCIITSVSSLKVGSKGIEVECLQKKVGVVADGSFGPLTKTAVITFQSNNRLFPDGIVGSLTRAVLNKVAVVGGNYSAGCTSALGYSPTTGTKCDIISTSVVSSITTVNVLPNVPSPVYVDTSSPKPPKVFSVSPEKVRSGDTVKIYGENFSSTGNTVRLRYAQIEDRFDNLSSNDGKVISFVFQPPEVKTMSKEELQNLPPTTLSKILDPIKALGGSIDDIVSPYRNMVTEDNLRQFLSNNGHNFDELYDKFYVTIENVYGHGSSNGPILAGLRKLSFGQSLAVSESESFLSKLRSFVDSITPKAYAQTPLGGINSGVVMYCTCGTGYLTFMTDFSTNGGTGLYWWSPGFVPTVGSPMISGPQLGFYTKNAGTCSVGVRPYCADITANTVSLPWGEGI